jgi:very-long-chain (3R)-3-hydroxyacyl-CoA dehydratase
MQFAAFAEIVHAAAGLVPSSPVAAFMQWLGRSNALFRIAQAIPELLMHVAAPLMLAVWSAGELVRYPWYALTAAGACPAWLTWLR